MDIRKLHYFVTLVRERHYSRAAKILYISQPSLSNAIKKLEDEVGFKLLARNTRSLELTEAGSLFYNRSVDLIRMYNNMIKELKEIKQVGSGTISIGLIESAKYWLPKVVRNFKDIYPNIQYQIKEILGEKDVIEALSRYNVHFMLTNQHIRSDEISLIPIYTEKFLLLTQKDDVLPQNKTITLHDLSERELIISAPGFQTREDVLQAFKAEKISPNIYFEIERLETACSLVEEGLGITILPESYIKYSPSSNIASRSIDSPSLERTVYIAYLENRYLSPAIFKLIGEIMAFFQEN